MKREEIDAIIIAQLYAQVQFQMQLAKYEGTFFTKEEFDKIEEEYCAVRSVRSEKDNEQIKRRLAEIVGVLNTNEVEDIVTYTPYHPRKENLHEFIEQLSLSQDADKREYAKHIKKYAETCKCVRCKPAFILDMDKLECLNKEKL